MASHATQSPGGIPIAYTNTTTSPRLSRSASRQPSPSASFSPLDVLAADPAISDMKREISELKLKLSDSTTILEARLIDMERENQRLKLELSQADVKISSLTNDRSFLLARSTDIQAELESVNKTLSDTKTEEQETEITKYKLRIAELEAQADQYRHQSRLDAQNSARVASDAEDQRAIQKLLSDQKSQIEQLERQNKALRSQVVHYKTIQENTEKLKEQKMALEHQVELLADVRTQLLESRSKLVKYETERDEWAKYLGKTGSELGVSSIHAMTNLLSAQRLEIATLREQIGERGVAAQQARIISLQKEIEKLEATITSHNQTSIVQQRQIQRLDAQLRLAHKEITSLKELLASYDEEEQSMQQGFDTQKNMRIADLEATLLQYKEQISSLEAELRSTLQRNATDVNSAATPSAAVNFSEPHYLELQKTNDAQKLEIESLERQIASLQHALGRGDYDPSTTRVLMLADNPESINARERHSLTEALTAENKKLRLQIQQALAQSAQETSQSLTSIAGSVSASQTNQSGTVVPIESLHTKEVECERLQQELDVRDKRIQRLKQVFSEKIQEYREAIYIILGYKVEIQMNGIIKVTSSFSQSGGSDPTFLFTNVTSKQASIQLSGGSTEALEELYKSMQIYVERQGSIPAFMAATTLDWFQRNLGS
eukprot:jgi/Hompol1/54/HPOL_005218-RA